MGFAVVTPRQLAPSVGSAGVGKAAPTVPISAGSNSSTPASTIHFGSTDFVPHLPAFRASFDNYVEGLTLAFGSMSFHVTHVGILRLQDPIRPHEAESSGPSNMATPEWPAIGPQVDPESNFDSVNSFGCDTPHFVGMVHHVNEEHGDSEDSVGSRSPNPRRVPAQVFMMNQGAEAAGDAAQESDGEALGDGLEDTNNGGGEHEGVAIPEGARPPRRRAPRNRRRRPQVHISEEDLELARARIKEKRVMPTGATREQLLVYQTLLHRKHKRLIALETQLDVRKATADASSARRAA